jgi:Derlin-2/3
MNELLGEIPPITKVIAGSAVLTSTLCSLHFIARHDLFFNLSLIIDKFEIWRVVTSFTYFGEFNIWVGLHLYFL